MDTLFPRLLAAAAALTVLTGPSGSTSGSINVGPGKPPILWQARGPVDMDYQAQRIHLRGDVKISQKIPEGEISIESDDAEATSSSKDFRRSHWVFTGKVHVRSESQGDLRSDHATVEIINGQLASALVTGSPAQFEQTRSSTGRLVRGHANAINYDVGSAVVKLTDDAFLTDDRNENEMKACEITYNVRTRQIQGESERCPDSRAHMTITPRSAPGSSAATAGSAPGAAQ